MRQRRIAGRYELLEQLGGSSWRAADTELERDVLVQMPARDLGVARLTHPSVVQVFDRGEENGESDAVLVYVPGASLERRLEVGPLGEAEARRIAADVTAARSDAVPEPSTAAILRWHGNTVSGLGERALARASAHPGHS